VSRTVSYKGHRIRALAIPVADSDDGAWAAQAGIRVRIPGDGRDQPLRDSDDRTFATEEDAEAYAVHIAMRRVDRHGV